MEGLLHNMSAPPRSKIILAPNIEEITFLAFSLDDLPLEDADFSHNLLRFCALSSDEQLREKMSQVENTLQLPAILTLGAKPRKSLPVSGLLTTIALLSKSTGSLYMKRRTPIFSHARLSQTIYLPHHHFLHLATQGGTLCLP